MDLKDACSWKDWCWSGQYFGHLMWRADSLEKTLMLGKIEGRRRRGQQRMRWLDGITDLMDMSLSKLWEIVKDKESLVCFGLWGWKESDPAEKLNNSNKICHLPSNTGSYLQYSIFFPSCASYLASAQALANILFIYPQKLCMICTNHFQSWHYSPCQFKLVSREPGLHLTFRVIKCSPIMILLAPQLFRKYRSFPVEL